MHENLKQLVEQAWEKRELTNQKEYIQGIEEVISLLDKGQIRVAQPSAKGWQVNEWVKKAVI
jgi:2,3,4,5-tetrahydropyridine-2-carboxylate N-succinyltransferase